MRRIRRGAPSLFLLFLLLGCGGKDGATSEDLRPVVVASIFPVGDLVRQAAGDGVRVEVLLPPESSPVTFDVTPRQFGDLQGASLFFMIGGGMDEWVMELTGEAEGTGQVVRLSEGIPLLSGGEGSASPGEASGNPHIWLDPVLVRDHLLPKIEDALAAAFPEASDSIRARSLRVRDSLTVLDEEIREALGALEERAFIATHAAWSYYASRYELEEVGVIHTHPGHEPSSRELAHLLEVARSHGIDCLFTEPQLGEVAARALATELSLPTRMLDPLGGPGQEGRTSYFDLMRFNTRQLAEGLAGGES